MIVVLSSAYVTRWKSFFSSLIKASQAWRKNKMDESKHEIHSQVDAITAGTASMVNLTAGTNTGTYICFVIEDISCLFKLSVSQKQRALQIGGGCFICMTAPNYLQYPTLYLTIILLWGLKSVHIEL